MVDRGKSPLRQQSAQTSPFPDNQTRDFSSSPGPGRRLQDDQTGDFAKRREEREKMRRKTHFDMAEMIEPDH